MFDASKRKNDDKPKGLPRRHVIARVSLSILLIAMLLGITVRLLSDRGALPTGRIMYLRDEEVIVLDLETGQRDQRDNYQYVPASKYGLDASPDGSWGASWHKVPARTEHYQLYMRQMSRTLRPFIAFRNWITWSFDSKWAVFSAYTVPLFEEIKDTDDPELWLINLETGEQTILTDNTYDDYTPLFSPDGTEILYVALSDGQRRLHVMNLATHQIIMLSSDALVYTFAWSPDSQWIVFETDHTGSSDLWIVRADGTGAQGIALDPDATERLPLWLPE